MKLLFNKKKRFIFCGLALITALLSSNAQATEQNTPMQPIPYPTPNYGAGAHKQLVERGEYLAKMGDCIACHTDTTHKNSSSFAGGYPIPTPFGTFYSPNITSDKETGIGKWNDDQFVRAMQHGVSPKGENYFPVFPYTSFTRVTRDDLLAIKAYLMSIPPVKKARMKDETYFPFSWRFLQYGWKILFFYPYQGVYRYDAAKSAEWNRGAYIVQGLGHCGECHTPRNIFGAMKHTYELTGAFVEGYYAPDITAHGLEGVSIDAVTDVFIHNNKYKNAGKAQGPMLEVNLDSLRYLTEADLKAIVVYLKTVKSREPSAPKSTGKIDASTGENIYTAYCAVCHDSGSAGAPKITDSADWTNRMKQGMPVVLAHAINGYNSMPPRGACPTCSDAEIKAAVEYIINQSQKSGASAVPTPPQAVKLTLADGQKVYANTCSVCHAQGLLGAPKVGDVEAWAPRIAQNIDVLIEHAIHGYRRMPPKGTCIDCTDAEIIAAVKYMVQQSQKGGDYSLW
jgi:cytochrome c5